MNHLLTLLAESVPGWVTVGGWILGPTGLGFALLMWIRFRKKDVANVSKTDAETEKLKADALLVKANADVTVADAALKLAQRLSDECNMAKQDLKEKDSALDKAQEDLNGVRLSLKEALEKVDKLQVELNKERVKNEDMSSKNQSMQLRIEELTTQLEKIKNS